ncbi:MAG: TonB-dependent receptor, partial [Bacteroidia bacterium]
MRTRFLIFILSLTLSIVNYQLSIAQQLTQTIRGTVVDKISNTPLPGANVLVPNSNPIKGVSTDLDGNFKLMQVPVGKQNLRITYVGYKDVTVSNIDVISGKEMVLNISLDENFVQGKEAVVTAKIEKNKPLNEMSTVSARTFSVEETQKFAAAVNDPARAASSFAGVIGTDDGNNTISIRGNSPTGLLWRMEGVDIPNPNHFSPPGAAGGGISILSSQLLTNSDFSTGAFAAEYGNALSGVFDLKLRKGNNEKHEYTFQAGLLGVDAAAEGPFKKGYAGSYLINYRYSTLSILGKIGVPLGDAVTNFQDLSYNISLPTNHAGNFTLFGFGGLSSQKINSSKDSVKWQENGDARYSDNFFSNTGATGITHAYILNEKTYLKSALVASKNGVGDVTDRLDDEYQSQTRFDASSYHTKFTLTSTLNHKINSKQSLRTGFVLNRIDYKIDWKDFNSDINALQQYINSDGTAYTAQLFGQTMYHLTEKLTVNGGIHFFELFTNKSYSVEPRASVKYEFSTIQSISFGYGMHSQLQPIEVYFAEFTDANG